MYVCSGAKLDVQLHVKVALLCVGGGAAFRRRPAAAAAFAAASRRHYDDARHAIILKSMAKSAR